jgi:uncharacterized protein YbbC (DUF1343 family)
MALTIAWRHCETRTPLLRRSWIRGAGASTIEGVATVLSGLDVLTGRRPTLLRGRRVALLCHQASVDRDLRHAAERVARLPGVRLAALWGPEHGFAGAAQDHAAVSSARGGQKDLRVFSLYGRRLVPSPQMLAGIDTVVVDLQDVGARYYTFVWTTVLAMTACAAAGVPVVLLDRPNPLGGLAMEGNLPDPHFLSFVGLWPLPARHGMTIGEVAAMVNERAEIGCDLTVVPMQGWRRAMTWADTGLPWVSPSPNMPTLDTALVYPGGCLVEGTNLSEGRGTTHPFELVGAPFLDGAALSAALTRHSLPGVRFRPARFIPTFHKWRGRQCEGVQVHVADPARFRPFATYVALIADALRLAPRAFRWRRPPYEYERTTLPIDLLAGGDHLRRALARGRPLGHLQRAWRLDVDRFARQRRPYLLYR